MISVIKPLRHFVDRPYLAGYTGPVQNFVMIVKEAVENSLDACEEKGILPDICVDIQRAGEGIYRITVGDNGPGIPVGQIETAFCKLASSKAFRFRQTRGTMGVGIKVALGLCTKLQAKPIATIVKSDGTYHGFLWRLDYNNERMDIVKKVEGPWDSVKEIIESDLAKARPYNFIIEFCFPARYTEKVTDYLRRLYLVNPHVHMRVRTPDGNIMEMKRIVDVPPAPPVEIKPPLKSATLGEIMNILKGRKEKVGTVLKRAYHGLTPSNRRLLEKALEKRGAGGLLDMPAEKVDHAVAEKLVEAISEIRQPKYKENCLSPVGAENIINTIKDIYKDRTKFVDCVLRYGHYGGGIPFVVEAALAEVEGLGGWEIYRYANRCPILIHESKCDLYDIIANRIKWGNYGIEENTPVLFLVHIASVHLPFLSTAKTALILPEEMEREVVLALQELGRRYCRRRVAKMERERQLQRGAQIYALLDRLAEEASMLAGKKKPDIKKTFIKIVGKKVAEEVFGGVGGGERNSQGDN